MVNQLDFVIQYCKINTFGQYFIKIGYPVSGACIVEQINNCISGGAVLSLRPPRGS